MVDLSLVSGFSGLGDFWVLLRLYCLLMFKFTA